MYFSGQHGKLEIATADSGIYRDVGKLKNWSYSTQQQTLDTTCLADVDKTILNGVRSTTGQASLLYYEDADVRISNAYLMGHDLIRTGRATNAGDKGFGSSAQQPARVLIKLSLPGGTGPNTRTTAMYAYITSFSLTCAVSEVVTAEVSWEAHGAPFEWSY